MKITGIDINPFYQEQAQYGKFIDWRALKNDPRDFRFIWIKCAEGTDGTSYTEGAARCIKGSLSVGFEAVHPYGYYLYQYADWTSGTAVWRVIPAVSQAQAFHKAAVDSGFPAGAHPMEDWEDPLVDQFLRWSDTESLNKAIAFARKLNAHLKSYHFGVEILFGTRSDIYSGDWWLRKWVQILLDNGYAAEVAWLKECYWVLADYDGTLNIPYWLPVDHVIGWQKTSSPVPDVDGIPTGRVRPGDALDIDEWLLTEAEFKTWARGGSPTTTGGNMARIFDDKIPMEKRAWVMTYTEDMKLTVPIDSLGLDAVILPMVRTPWDGSHSRVLPVSSFAGRLEETGNTPAFGMVEIDAGIATTEQHDQREFDEHTVWQNIYVKPILDAWHVGPWSQSTLKPADFRPIRALIFEMKTETDHRSPAVPIEDFWQSYMFKYTVDHLRVLMIAGAVPNIPIVLKASCNWLAKYKANFDVMLQGGDRSTWLWLMLSDPKLDSTGIMPDLWSMFSVAPGDDYQFPYVPNKYANRVAMLEFTAGKQRMAFSSGTAYMAKAFTTASEFSKWMGASAVTPPPVVVPPVPGEIVSLADAIAAIKDLQAWRTEMGKIVLPK